MTLMKHEVERLNEIMRVVVEFVEHDVKAKDLLQYLLNGRNQTTPNHSTPAAEDGEPSLPPENIKIVKVPVEVEKIIYQDRVVEKIVPTVPDWVADLEPFVSEVVFFQQVQQEPSLANILLPNSSHNIKQLVVNACQWHNILRVWDELASLVKTHQHSITDNQQQILSHCLALYNLTLSQKQASLHTPKIGDSYDYDFHEQVSGKGDSISAVLLASLYNAGNEKVRPALVITH